MQQVKVFEKGDPDEWVSVSPSLGEPGHVYLFTASDLGVYLTPKRARALAKWLKRFAAAKTVAGDEV